MKVINHFSSKNTQIKFPMESVTNNKHVRENTTVCCIEIESSIKSSLTIFVWLKKHSQTSINAGMCITVKIWTD